jgi:hypothetical protein
MEVPAGSAHVRPHTDSSTIATLEQAIEPRSRFVPVFYASWLTWLTWLAEGRVDEQDEPTLLDAVAILRAAGGGTWLSGVPVAVQKALVPVLAGVARARGIRAVVPPGI